MSNPIHYMAIAHNDKYTVGSDIRLDGVKPVNNVRDFETYEEADECAKRIASGEFGYYSPGQYVSNR